MSNSSLFKAERAMALGQYTRTVKYFKAYLRRKPRVPLNEQELNMLSDAYKNRLNQKRYTMRKLKVRIESLGVEDEEYTILSSKLDTYRNEMILICRDVIDIINDNLIFNCVETRESVLIHTMKGDFYRCIWEEDNNEVTCRETTKEYHTAYSLCEWNFESSDPLLLKTAMKYAFQLSDAGNNRLAIVILKRVIDNAQEHLDKNYLADKPIIESLIMDLNNNLIMFIDNQRIVDYIEELVSGMIEPLENQSADNIISRRQG
ncbi:14-3-3 protein,14-3-3 domain [Cinara cedri]|uniref:14-3-3 protein,14-3-3 domain n=1 Tax=Cinara cedri TaxID=506608 RepID=A0A5E4MY97_9HEMI|nr:14-3-3 protein,14-3-3 domain [Cinara cedri]